MKETKASLQAEIQLLYKRNHELEKEVDELEEKLTEERRDRSKVEEDLRDRLKYERSRAAQALECADNASIATAAIGRLTNNAFMMLDTLERKFDKDVRGAR